MGRPLPFMLTLIVMLLGGQAWAQGYLRPPTSPYQTPPVSPYLNLMRGGNPAINYYDLVRPQRDTSGTLQRLQLQQAQSAFQAPAATAGLAITGHPATFINYSHYYYYNMGAYTPVSGLRAGAAGAAALQFSNYLGNPALTGAGIPSFSFITGTGIGRP